LRVANYFYHQYLQEQLVADVIIPHLTPMSAVALLKECYANIEEGSNSHRKSCTYAWTFLYDYA